MIRELKKLKAWQLSGAALSALAAGSAFADSAVVVGGGTIGISAIGVALAVGLAAIGVALGMGLAAGRALEGIARNPTSSKEVFTPLVLALAFMEVPALLGFAVAYLLMGKL